MTRLFSKVSPAVWRSKRFLALPTSDAKLAYLFMLTNEHVTSAGAYRLKEGYAVSDLGWDIPRYREALAHLVAAKLIAHDEGTSEVYVQRWFKHNPPQNDKHAQGCQRMILELDSEVIAELAMADFEEAEQRRLAPISKASPALRASLQAVNGGRKW